MHHSGETEYDAIWYKEVQVRGKYDLLGSIFDEIEDLTWDLIKKQ